MAAQMILGILMIILALWLLVLGAITASKGGLQLTVQAPAPIAAFAKNGDDRTLPPISWALHKSRHDLVSGGDSSPEPSPADQAPPPRSRKMAPAPTSNSSTSRAPGPQSSPNSSSSSSNSSNSGVSGALVPGFFVYGDSTVDVGNNNYLQTIARANLAPYGRDFDTHQATGRFSNGRLSIDYLAVLMGLPFVPPLLSKVNLTTSLHGINFASAGAGILNPSGSDLGQHIPMSEQVQHVEEIQHRLASRIGEEAANSLISKSIHYISIGSNDFIHYYLRNVSSIRNKISSIDFNQLLITTLVAQIEELYTRGIRKVAAVGIGPLGCVPFYLYFFNQTSSGCVDDINFMIAEYNAALRISTQALAMKHRNLKITFCDIFRGLMPIVRNPSQYGFVTSRSACCGVGRFGGWLMCMLPQMACSNAGSYLWWDEFHPTDKANSLLANEIWSGQVCEPLTLQELAAL